MCSATSSLRQEILRALGRVACQPLGELNSESVVKALGWGCTMGGGVPDTHAWMCIMSDVACRVMYGEQARFFDDEIHPTIKHTKKGLVAMAGEKHCHPSPCKTSGMGICPCTFVPGADCASHQHHEWAARSQALACLKVLERT